MATDSAKARCRSVLDGGAWGQSRDVYWGARPAPVYVEVQYLLLGFRAVTGWYIPVVPARDIFLSR